MFPGFRFPGLCGGVAQLGERLLCKQEVIGSNPFTSTGIAVGVSTGRGLRFLLRVV